MRAAVLILFLASSLAFGGCLMRQRTGKDGKGPEISMDNSEISVSIHADEAELAPQLALHALGGGFMRLHDSPSFYLYWVFFSMSFW